MDFATNYSKELGRALEADFLLLSPTKKGEFITSYSLDKDKPDFSKLDLSLMWSMELFILKNLSKEELQRRVWIIREKFRLQSGDTVFNTYKCGLPDEISDEALKKPITEETERVLREDVANIARQSQRLNYYRIQRNHEVNKKKKIPIWILIGLLVAGTATFFYTNGFEAEGWKLILLAMYFGMTGSIVSLIQRIEQASHAPTNFTDTALDATDISQGMSASYIVSLVFSGAVFSVLVYLLSRSQLINILELLPKFEKEECMKAFRFFCKTFMRATGPSPNCKTFYLMLYFRVRRTLRS